MSGAQGGLLSAFPIQKRYWDAVKKYQMPPAPHTPAAMPLIRSISLMFLTGDTYLLAASKAVYFKLLRR
jgi:hypothetical protein